MIRKLYRLIRRVPYVPEAIQAGLLMGAGDVIAQTFVEKKAIKEMDKIRSGRFILIGTICVGPPLRMWYGILHKYIIGSNKIVALKKVAVDQFLFAPFFMGILLGIINLSQGHSVTAIREQMERDYYDILLNNYKVWPMVQLINFYLIPLKFQVAVVQLIAIFWNTYISWKTNKPFQEK